MMPSGNFILLDAARMGESMDEAKNLNQNFEPLFSGKTDILLQSVGPFIFNFNPESEFHTFYVEKGWGDHWGVLLFSTAGTRDLSLHFKRFLKVKTEDGLELYFRFYDPRVLRIFLPTCDSTQLYEFFGPVDYFLMEGESKEFGIKFWLENGWLKTKKILFDEINLMNWTEKKGYAKIAETESGVSSNFSESKKEDETINLSQPPVAKTSKPKWNMFD